MVSDDKQTPGIHPADQAREQTGQQQVRLRVDERELKSSYANAFRTHGTAEEVMLDFGINIINPATQQQPQQDANAGQPEIVFQVKDRIFLNYFSAKRLAITLSQLVRRHESEFGELELDVNKRRRGGGASS